MKIITREPLYVHRNVISQPGPLPEIWLWVVCALPHGEQNETLYWEGRGNAPAFSSWHIFMNFLHGPFVLHLLSNPNDHSFLTKMTDRWISANSLPLIENLKEIFWIIVHFLCSKVHPYFTIVLHSLRAAIFKGLGWRAKLSLFFYISFVLKCTSHFIPRKSPLFIVVTDHSLISANPCFVIVGTLFVHKYALFTLSLRSEMWTQHCETEIKPNFGIST